MRSKYISPHTGDVKKRLWRANHRVSFHYPSTIPSPTPSTTIAPRHCRPAPHPPTSPAPPPVPSCFERQHATNQPFFHRAVDVSANRFVPITALPVMFAAPRWVAPHHRTTTSPAAPPTAPLAHRHTPLHRRLARSSATPHHRTSTLPTARFLLRRRP